MKHLLFTSLLFISLSALAQKPEKQISFALEKKSNAYYVQQAELWWKEVEMDKSNEDSWYNYYRACRNAHGSANWSSEFIKSSPALKFGADIVLMMEKYIPDTFTYRFVKGSDSGVSPANGTYLLQAFQMKPDFDGIHADMVTYSVSTHNDSLRRQVNKEWAKKTNLSRGLHDYAYNVLQSLAPNAILFTQHDNDTYPVWLLQDAKNIRQDVRVINIDFLIFDEYRNKIFPELELPPMKVDRSGTDVYEVNWKSIVSHLLSNYQGSRPLYLALTISPSLFKGFENNLQLSGLALRLGQERMSAEQNARLINDKFLLDQVCYPLVKDVNQQNADIMNLNYLKPLGMVYQYYKKANANEANKLKRLAISLIERVPNASASSDLLRDFE